MNRVCAAIVTDTHAMTGTIGVYELGTISEFVDHVVRHIKSYYMRAMVAYEPSLDLLKTLISLVNDSTSYAKQGAIHARFDSIVGIASNVELGHSINEVPVRFFDIVFPVEYAAVYLQPGQNRQYLLMNYQQVEWAITSGLYVYNITGCSSDTNGWATIELSQGKQDRLPTIHKPFYPVKIQQRTDDWSGIRGAHYLGGSSASESAIDVAPYKQDITNGRNNLQWIHLIRALIEVESAIKRNVLDAYNSWQKPAFTGNVFTEFGSMCEPFLSDAVSRMLGDVVYPGTGARMPILDGFIRVGMGKTYGDWAISPDGVTSNHAVSFDRKKGELVTRQYEIVRVVANNETVLSDLLKKHYKLVAFTCYAYHPAIESHVTRKGGSIECDVWIPTGKTTTHTDVLDDSRAEEILASIKPKLPLVGIELKTPPAKKTYVSSSGYTQQQLAEVIAINGCHYSPSEMKHWALRSVFCSFSPLAIAIRMAAHQKNESLPIDDVRDYMCAMFIDFQPVWSQPMATFVDAVTEVTNLRIENDLAGRARRPCKYVPSDVSTRLARSLSAIPVFSFSMIETAKWEQMFDWFKAAIEENRSAYNPEVFKRAFTELKGRVLDHEVVTDVSDIGAPFA